MRHASVSSSFVTEMSKWLIHCATLVMVYCFLLWLSLPSFWKEHGMNQKYSWLISPQLLLVTERSTKTLLTPHHYRKLKLIHLDCLLKHKYCNLLLISTLSPPPSIYKPPQVKDLSTFKEKKHPIMSRLSPPIKVYKPFQLFLFL